jgi:hypothetical protein
MNTPQHHIWVFAYGSNMHLADLRRWLTQHDYPCDGIYDVQPALIEGYELVWNYRSKARSGGAANVQKAPSATLWGLALAVCATTFEGLDAKEGHPHRYHRGAHPKATTLIGPERRVESWLYQVLPEFTHPTPQLPRQAYLQLMVDAAEQFAAPPDYMLSLRTLQRSCPS